MPNVVIPLQNVAQSVSRPVIIDMITQVQKLTKINSGTKIFFPGDLQKMRTPGSDLDGKNERDAVFNTDRYSFIEVEEDYDQDSLGTTAVDREEHIPVFEDNALGVQICPVYSTTKVSINFTYRCPSKSEATKWRDEARLRISQMFDINMHKLTYHYQLPLDVIAILQEIHGKREANVPYGEDFVTYVRGHATPRLTLTSNTAGESERLAVAETQTRIQGLFDFDGVPEKAQRDEATGTWSVTFVYKFSYEKPIAAKVQYPIMVHNQLLASDFIEFTNKAYDSKNDPKTFSLSLSALNSFEMDTLINARHHPEERIRIPEYDDFLIEGTYSGLSNILTVLTEVDSVDKRSLFNLRELGDFAIDEDILEFIRLSEARFITFPYMSILNLSLYRNKYLASGRHITCDVNLNVLATTDLDLRKQHRVSLGVFSDLTIVSAEALNRLRQFPKALVKIMGAMNEALRDHPDFKRLSTRPVIHPADFNVVTSFLTGARASAGSSNYYGPGIGSTDLFADVDPRLVEEYRSNGVMPRRLMNFNIDAMRKN